MKAPFFTSQSFDEIRNIFNGLYIGIETSSFLISWSHHIVSEQTPARVKGHRKPPKDWQGPITYQISVSGVQLTSNCSMNSVSVSVSGSETRRIQVAGGSAEPESEISSFDWLRFSIF